MKTAYERTLKRMEEDLKLAGYSPRTVGSYVGVASRFLRHTGKPARQINGADVRRYFLFLTEEKKAASSTINQAHFGVRFLFRDVLGKPWRQKLRRHKRPQRLPVVLSREEIKALLQATPSLRDRTLWMTLYAAGLRIHEAVQLRVGDTSLDGERWVASRPDFFLRVEPLAALSPSPPPARHAQGLWRPALIRADSAILSYSERLSILSHRRLLPTEACLGCLSPTLCRS